MMIKKVPLSWVDFEFFTEFLMEINKDLLNIPVFGKKIDLNLIGSLKSYDIEYKSKKSIISYYRAISRKASIDLKRKLKKQVKKLFYNTTDVVKKKKNSKLKHVDNYLDSKDNLLLFNKEQIINSGKLVKIRVATIELFLDSLIERNGDRVVLKLRG